MSSDIKIQLQEAIVQAVNRLQGLSLRPEEIHLEHPENEKFGDWVTNVALKLKAKSENLPAGKAGLKTTTKNLKLEKLKTPLEIAEAIVKELKKHSAIQPFSHKIQAVKPGFINILIKTEWFIKQIERVLTDKEKYGKREAGSGKKIMVEYAHPNTHKAFHVGHLRNITNGEAMVRILKALGYKIIRANYQGDVGLHIAKCLYGILHKLKIQNEKFKIAIQNAKLKTLDDKIKFLGKCYVRGNKVYEGGEKAKKEILKINKKIYNKSDPEINKLWKETRQWSLDYFERIYKRVYSRFDRYYFEAEVAEPGKKIVLENLKKGIFKKSKGAVIFPGSKYGLHDRVFITGEGNATYEGKDMELGRLQFEEYNPDLIIHNVGPEQAEYFKVAFEALAQIYPKTRGREYHLIYGWVRLKKGKMSSRLGNVITGEWLLDEAKKRIKKAFTSVEDRTAEMVAVAAVKYSFLKVSPSQDLAFDFDESINLQGNSGPYLQYTYARVQSVLRKSQISHQQGGQANLKSQIYNLNLKSYKFNVEELSVLRTFYKFPEVVLQAGDQYAPNLICSFLYDLAQKFNTFYNRHRILIRKTKNENLKTITKISKLEDQRVEFRVALTAVVAQILKSGLDLLGIKCPEKM